MTAMGNLFKEKAGSVMMIGVEGTKMTPSLRRLVQTVRPGGIIFFRPNFSTASAIKKFISDLEKAAGKKLLTAVDHEGGRVIHASPGMTVFPDNLVLGNTGKEIYARRQGEIEACELRKLGLLMNLAPTIDVLGENYSPNIGIRSYGKDPELVSRLGMARIREMQKNGVAACAKHFPGQGHSNLDAHLDLPVLSARPGEIEKVHLPPFAAAIKAGVEAVMSSHPIYPQLDSSGVPATFSRKIIHGLLREKMKFDGLILSDDLEMGALKNIGSIGSSAVRAMEAGHDMVLVCHRAQNVLKVYDALAKAYESGRLNAWDLEKCLVRIERVMKKYASLKPRPVQSKNLPELISRAGVLRLENHDGFHFKKGDKVTIALPRFSDLAGKIFIEPSMLDEADFARELCSGSGLVCEKALVTGIRTSDRDEEEMQNVGGHLIYFCYDAHFDSRVQRILKILPRRNRKAAVVLLRNPYDEGFVSLQLACVKAFGFRSCQIKAALNLLIK